MKYIYYISVLLFCSGMAACSGEIDPSNPFGSSQPKPPATPPVDTPPPSDTPTEPPETPEPPEAPEPPAPQPPQEPPRPPESPVGNDFTVLSTVPENLASNLAVNSTVSLTLNKPLMTSSINNNTVEWVTTEDEQPVAYTWDYVANTQVLTLSAEQALDHNQEYRIRVDEALLSEDSDMMTVTELRFTTEKAPDNTPPPTVSQDCMTEEDAVILQLVNRHRTEGATCGGQRQARVAPLTWNCQLAKASADHSQDMATHNYFSHTGRDGSSHSQRIARTGYSSRASGENIARGQRSPEEVMDSWMRSAGHCRNIMRANYTEMGHGMVQSARGPYWTQLFATPR